MPNNKRWVVPLMWNLWPLIDDRLSFSYIALHHTRNHACLIGSQKPLPVSNAKSGMDVGIVESGSDVWVMFKRSFIVPSIYHMTSVYLQGLPWFLQHTPPNWIVCAWSFLYPRVLTFSKIVEFWPLVELLLECPQAYVLSMWILVRLSFDQQCHTARTFSGQVASCNYDVLYFSQLEWPIGCWYVD